LSLSGRDIALFSVTLTVLGGSLYADWNWELVWSACGLLLLAYAIFIKNAFSLAYTVIALLAPLSVKIALPFADLYLPSEFLTASLALSVAAVLLLSKQGGLLLKNPLPALWLLTFIPGMIASELPQTSVKFFALNALFVTAFYYGGLLLAARGNAFPWTAFLTGLVPVGLWGLYQFSRYNFNPITISGIFKPFFYSHTMLGAVAAFMAAVALSKARTQRWWLLVALVATVAVGFSTSRAALWSLVFMGGLFALGALPKALRVAVPALAVAGFFGLGGWVKLDEAFTYNSYESHDPQASLVEQSMSVTNVQSDASNIERLNRWTSALAMFNERPFTGFGPGTYQFTYIPFQDKRLENRLTVTNPNSPPHLFPACEGKFRLEFQEFNRSAGQIIFVHERKDHAASSAQYRAQICECTLQIVHRVECTEEYVNHVEGHARESVRKVFHAALCHPGVLQSHAVNFFLR